MIKRLAHICIRTTDLEATRRFYGAGLGLTEQFDFVRDGKPFGFYLKLGDDSFIEVFKGEPGEVGNINHLAIEVEDIDAVAARLANIGVETTRKKLGADQTWQCWATDPSGVRIEFQQYTPESKQLVGGTAVVDW